MGKTAKVKSKATPAKDIVSRSPRETTELLVTPTKKPKINASRGGLMPKMDEDDIDKLTSEDSKQIVKLLSEYFRSSVESITSAYSLSASPNGSSPAGNFETVWKNYMGY
jgi:hypothetical protein